MAKLHNVRLVQGNEACALGALAAGATFYAGYPITPSTEIAEHASKHMPKMGRYFIQMEDEIASIGAVIGAAAVGHKAFTATSGPGFSLMQELLGYGSITELPMVIINVMRGGPSTGLPTLPSQGDVMQARYGTHGDHSIIAISPNSVTETYYETIRAFNLAQKYRTPVLMMIDEKIGHMRERFDVDESAEVPVLNPLESFEGEYIPYKNTENLVPDFLPLGKGHRYHITGLTHNEKGFYSSEPKVVDAFARRICDKIENNTDDITTYEEVMLEDAEIVLIAYGSISRTAREALEELRAEGVKVGLLRLITLWPFNYDKVTELIKDKKAVVVPEMNLGQMASVIKSCAGVTPVHSLSRIDGDIIAPAEIVAKVKEVL